MIVLRGGAFQFERAGGDAPPLSAVSALTERDGDKAPVAAGKQSRSTSRSVSAVSSSPSSWPHGETPPDKAALALSEAEPEGHGTALRTVDTIVPLGAGSRVVASSASAACREARRAWERSMPQLFLEVDA